LVWVAVVLCLPPGDVFPQTPLPGEGSAALDAAQALGATAQATAASATAPQGTLVQARSTATPPQMTAAQYQTFLEQLAQSHRPGPPSATTIAPLVQNRGPEVPSPDPTRNATDSFLLFRDSVIPSTGIAGGYAFSSPIGEPSLAVSGKIIFQTGNWYASYSHDNGATWNFLNPFTLFGTDFCCDQVTLYDASRDRYFWLLQYSDRLVLANTADPSGSWCAWNITPAWFGLPANTELDYNDLALSKNFLYLTTNLFTGASGSLIARFPLDPLTTCSSFNFNWVQRTDSFTFKPVQGAVDVMYWGSNWGQTNGSSFRIYSWAENSGQYFFYDRTIPTFTFMVRNNGQNCASANGVVTNWCQFADSRVLGGYLAQDVNGAGGVLGFSFNAQQDASFPFPYTYRVYFSESDKTFLARTNLWATWGALLFLSLAPNTRGNIGGTFTWGGGTGTSAYYPGWGLLIDDDFAPTQPWHVAYIRYGGGNACPDSRTGLGRWGDYLTVRPFSPVGAVWVASGYTIQGNHCGVTGWYAEPRNAIFGRGRDAGSVTRWQSE